MSESSSVNFKIFGDIKQRYLPFVIDPNKIAKEINDNENKIQLFSFKPTNDKTCAYKQLNIVPDSYKRIFNEDIANQLLYTKNSSGKITFDDILNNMPVIEIREFLPDTKLEQFLNLFGEVLSYVMDKVKNFFNKDKNNATESNKESAGFGIDSLANVGKEVDKKTKDMINKCFNYLSPSGNDANNTTNLFVKDGNSRFEGKPDLDKAKDPFNLYYKTGANNSLERIMMHDFPKFMYYKLQSVTNSNVYVIPNNLNDKLLYNSDGTKGWSKGGMAVSQAVDNIPLVGGLISKLLKGPLGIFDNLRISYMPYWESENGQDARPVVKIEFELVNDTVESALNNFLFVNTIVPNNKIVQYGMFQHSPCLYDVKIGGYDRLFACAGKFEVKHKGMLRIPSNEFFNKIQKHVNKTITDVYNSIPEFIKGLRDYDLIRIPDTYEVTMEFTSLLPASFNNYMFTYSTNTSIANDIKSLKTYADGPFASIVKDSVKDMNTVLFSDTANNEQEKPKEEAKKASNLETQPDITKAGE